MFSSIQEWEQKRIGKITASKAFLVMKEGKGKAFSDPTLKYIDELASEFLTKTACNSERFQAAATEWGNANEFFALDRFKKDKGFKDEDIVFYGGSNPVFFDYTERSGGSPDGKAADWLLEVKCPYNSGVHLNYLKINNLEEFKEKCEGYYWQMVMNMLCLGVEKGYFISYDPRYIHEQLQIKILEVTPKKEDFESFKKRLTMAENLLTETILSVASSILADQ